MTNLKQIPQDLLERYEIHNFRHALSIFSEDYNEEFLEFLNLLRSFTITETEIKTPGGRKSPIAQKFDTYLYERRWKEKKWDISIEVDGKKKESPTHAVDYCKEGIAIELEWNNKDPFYDRDLNNFRLLHQLGIIGIGVIVTRSDNLQEVFNKLGKGKSYGASTTHMGKLLPKILGGGAAECPLLVIGIKKEAVKQI